MDNLTLAIDASPGISDGQRVVALTGPLTINTPFDFQKVMRAESAPAMILDLSGVPYVDSAGLGSIVNAMVSCSKSGRQFVLAGVGERVQSMMKMTRVESAFKFFPTALDAQKGLVP
jgi:anti-sigma B factor antagonist